MFVDSDNYVFISIPLSKAIETDADLILFGYKTSWYSTPPIFRDYYPIAQNDLKSQVDIYNLVFPFFFGMSKTRFEQWLDNDPRWYDGKELASVWRFLYKRDFIECNSLRFRNLKLGEDSTFMWDCLLKANSLATSKNSSYVYLPMLQGTFTTTLASKILESKLKILEQRNRISSEIKAQYGVDINDLYMGSNIISAMQIGMAMAETGKFADWKIFLNDNAVRSSISNISMNYSGGKTMVANIFAKTQNV